MFPLSYFLVAWVILLAIFGFMTLLTLIQVLRHGLPSVYTYVFTFSFLLITAGVVIWTSLYFTRVDWSTEVSLVPSSFGSFFPVEQR